MSLKEFENSTPVFPITAQGVERTWKTTPETFFLRYKSGDIVAREEDGRIVIYEKLREDQVIKTHWIDKKYHGKIFGKFFQLENIYTKTGSSTGLGLAITKELVEMHKGKITIESEVDKGSTFTVYLPKKR